MRISRGEVESGTQLKTRACGGARSARLMTENARLFVKGYGGFGSPVGRTNRWCR